MQSDVVHSRRKTKDRKTKAEFKQTKSKGHIVFQDVTVELTFFPKLLNKVSFEILPGQKVGMVGRESSDLNSIPLALYRSPSEGMIFIDNEVLSSVDVVKDVFILHENPILYSETIRGNLDILKQYNDSELWNALEIVKLKDQFVLCGVDLDSELDVKMLSPTVKQHLFLAGAVIKNPKILIIKESEESFIEERTSKLHEIVLKTFSDSTVIFLARHPETIQDCEKIFFFDDGEIVEEGDPSVLLKNTSSRLSNQVLNLNNKIQCSKNYTEITSKLKENKKGIFNSEFDNKTEENSINLTPDFKDKHSRLNIIDEISDKLKEMERFDIHYSLNDEHSDDLYTLENSKGSYNCEGIEFGIKQSRSISEDSTTSEDRLQNNIEVNTGTLNAEKIELNSEIADPRHCEETVEKDISTANFHDRKIKNEHHSENIRTNTETENSNINRSSIMNNYITCRKKLETAIRIENPIDIKPSVKKTQKNNLPRYVKTNSNVNKTRSKDKNSCNYFIKNAESIIQRCTEREKFSSSLETNGATHKANCDAGCENSTSKVIANSEQIFQIEEKKANNNNCENITSSEGRKSFVNFLLNKTGKMKRSKKSLKNDISIPVQTNNIVQGGDNLCNDNYKEN